MDSAHGDHHRHECPVRILRQWSARTHKSVPWWKGTPGRSWCRPNVVAELDYLVATRRGVESELAVLRELASGAYLLADMSADDVRSAARIVERFADQEIGLADASLLVLAERCGTTDVLTLDRRHFDVLRFADGRAPTVLP